MSTKDDKSDSPFAKLAGLRDALPPGKARATPEEKAARAAAAKAEALAKAYAGKIVVKHERKGRGGKTVTLVSGVVLDAEGLEGLCREMKKSLGCGAAVEEGHIVLQGDLVDRAMAFLEKKGASKLVRGSS